MNVETIWVVGLGTAFTLVVILGATYVLRSFRNRYVPSSGRRARGDALAELHLLQAEMQRKLDDQEGDSPHRVPDPAAMADAATSMPAAPTRPTSPLDGETREKSLADLKALQAKMRKKLEEDRAREAAEGGGPPDPELEEDHFEP